MIHLEGLFMPNGTLTYNINQNLIKKNFNQSNIDILEKLLSNDLDFHNSSCNYVSHNFHSFPAKFPPQLPQHFIQALTKPGDIVLDPMVGSEQQS